MPELLECQGLDAPLDEVWAFFSNAANLAALTPPEQGLRVGKGGATPIFPGHRVQISVAPFGPFRSRWTTLIGDVVPPDEQEKEAWFNDIQLNGPFARWDHLHAFRAIPGGGVAVMDRVEYAVPLGRLGAWVAGRWVDRQISALFAYRREQLRHRFGEVDLPAGWEGGWTVGQ